MSASLIIAEPPVATAVRPITLRAAPRREPPFDDERPDRALTTGGQQLPFDPDTVRVPRLGRHQSWVTPMLADRGDLPDPAIWSRRLLMALIETRAGLRPLRQLAGYFSANVFAGLSTDLEQLPTSSNRRRQVSLNSVHVCEPAIGVAEACAVLYTGSRYRAIAIRLEAVDGRWHCVRLQVG